jgi:hypothetical protein
MKYKDIARHIYNNNYEIISKVIPAEEGFDRSLRYKKIHPVAIESSLNSIELFNSILLIQNKINEQDFLVMDDLKKIKDELEMITACGCDVKKKDISKCSECSQVFCQRHIYYYIDEANISITKNSKPHCEDCYSKKYKPFKFKL